MKSPKIHPVLVYTDKEGIPGWWTLLINVADAAIGLRRASKNKEMWTKKTLCFTAVEMEKNVTTSIHRTRLTKKYSHVRVLLIDGGAVKKTLGHSTKESKSNNLEPHFPTSATKSRSLEDTKTAVALPHCSETTRDSIAGWWTFRLEVTPELWRKYRTSYIR